jgi:hypothetical protein
VIELQILHGCCTIMLWRRVGGKGYNFHPDKIRWEICGNTLVSEADFHRFHGFEIRADGSQVFQVNGSPVCKFRWLRYWSDHTQSYYVCRNVRGINGRTRPLYLAREILGLQAGSSDEADHVNHDTTDNTLKNLRIATEAQNGSSRRPYNTQSRFKGVTLQKYGGWQAKIRFKGTNIYFQTMSKEIESGLMFYYASVVIHKDFHYHTVFPPDEMPVEERQQELWEMVLVKLRKKGVEV